ncbi:lipase/acyltransferase domain-containing protein [Brevibacillus sp. SYSU BS000544]|uniref:lipase/acyltransferase domain-containing protein n=1 Tax=Brevibacillus sp. SYSU BS000544 TaxID=3416443 RepID=UPI003CE47E01
MLLYVRLICCIALLLPVIVQPFSSVTAHKSGKDETKITNGYGYELEPNNVFDKADWTYSNKAAYGTVSSKSDIDFWKIKATGNGKLQITLKVPQAVTYRTTMFDETKTELGSFEQNDSDGEVVHSISVQKDKWFYLAVSSGDGRFDKKKYYMLKAVFIPEGLEINPDEYEPNNSSKDAKAITGSENLEGTIHESADVDFYKITNPLSSTVKLTLTGIPEGMDLDLYLLDSAQKELAKSTKAKNLDEQITYNGNAGVYFVKVQFNSRSKLVPSTYRLRVTVNTIPVILIPGVGGSRLIKLQGTTRAEAWINMFGMAADEDAHLESLSLIPKKTGSEQVVPKNSQIAIVPEEGDEGLYAIAYLTYGKLKERAEQYDRMAKHLQSLGYKTGVSLFGFPYDWRLSNSENAKQLKVRIDDVLKKSGANQVQLVAHSMGGLLTKETLLSNISYQSKVQKIIYMGTPFLGSPRAYQALKEGYNFGIPFFSEGTSKQVCQFAPAVFDLMPSRQYVQRQKYLYKKNGESLTAYNYDDVYKNPVLNTIYLPLLRLSDRLHAKWDTRLLPIPQYVIIGDSQLTFLGYRIVEALKSFVPFYDSGEGDGTVPIVSSNYSMKDTRKKYYVSDEHAKLPTNLAVIHQVANLLHGYEQVQEGIRETPATAPVDQIAYLIIYRQDGQFPEVTIGVENKTYAITKESKQATNSLEQQLNAAQSKAEPKIEYHGNVVVFILPSKDALASLQIKSVSKLDAKSSIIIERHVVNPASKNDQVTNYTIKQGQQQVNLE